jgi:hydroxymethylglutaryl-CoA reductase (NADPH)
MQSIVSKGLYAAGSVKRSSEMLSFRIKNILMDAVLTRVLHLTINGVTYEPSQIELRFPDRKFTADGIDSTKPLALHKGDSVEIVVNDSLAPSEDRCHIQLGFETAQFGNLQIDVTDKIGDRKLSKNAIPYDKVDDFSPDWIKRRQEFLSQFTGKESTHIKGFSFDPYVAKGNIENFTGIAQVPLGIAGPIKIDGEHAKGEFLIPLATTEGTLVASYSRGMKAINLAGGVKVTVVEDRMQRAPVFAFDSAREARDFSRWVSENLTAIRKVAESTSRIVKLLEIETYLSNRFAYLRFNYSTGDAAGQNMVGKATFAACEHIVQNNRSIRKYYLESNMATDKKGSAINTLRTRGKRVIAECTVPRKVLKEVMRVEPESLQFHGMISNIGAMMSGANNNGLHSANGITAMFIATGQDVANLAESSAGILYSEITPKGDFYLSLTIPSLIVATHGGGTGLPTQKECLDLMDCYGPGKVYKLAEIIAAVALAGELSLGSAISSLDWVSSHERMGRNR